ncbi:hypothetical protein IFO70_27555 [Phormidium tenue FACHB-886]|nr:hypothetical protein [Phormidium tenue FACHB-886]
MHSNGWQFGINLTGDIVGVVLPVTFNECAKEGVEEETIYYMGFYQSIEGLVLQTIFALKQREHYKRSESGEYFAIWL